MPVVHFHLIDTPANRDGVGRLLEDACALYAEVLDAPVERAAGIDEAADRDDRRAGGQGLGHREGGYCSRSQGVSAGIARTTSPFMK